MYSEELDVWMNGEIVATLFPDTLGSAALRYTPETLDKYGPSYPLLSVRLPTRPETYPSVMTEVFLDGLLPEDEVRSKLAGRARVATGDTPGMLHAYGMECAGAIQVMEKGASPVLKDPEVLWLSESELERYVSELPTAPLGVSIDEKVRVSLGGLQGKLLVVTDGNRMGIPVNGTPSTHILKPARLKEDGSELWPGIAELETFGLRLIEACGSRIKNVKAAEAKTVSIAGRKAILVTRFDRREEGSSTKRIHQEDFCQALGVRDKYQQSASSSPSLKEIAELIRAKTSKPIIELNSLLRLLTLNLAIGNCDMHAKNLALLLDGGVISLTPAYDVVPTAAWDMHDTELSLRVGGEAFLEDLRSENLVEEAVSWGIREVPASRQIKTTLDTLLLEIPRVIREAKNEGWFHPRMGELEVTMHSRIRSLRPTI